MTNDKSSLRGTRRLGAVVLALAFAAPAGCDDPEARAEECGGIGAPCCLTYPNNDPGYQYTCDLGNACVAEVCQFTGGLEQGFVSAFLTSTAAADAVPVDDQLQDPWFVDASGPLIVGNRSNGVIAAYDVHGARTGTVSTAGQPTGGVRSHGAGFQVKTATGMQPADYLWADERGRILGSVATAADGNPATVLFDGSADGARYTGLALRPTDGVATDRLYAVDAGRGRIVAWDDVPRPLALAGDFVAPGQGAALRPFGIAQIEGRLWVSYVERAADGTPRTDRGHVVIFDGDGHFVEHLDRSETLAAPWGMAQAPMSGFGDLNSCALIAGSGDGGLHAWCRDADHHFAYRGPVADEEGRPIVLEGVRGLGFRWDPAGKESAAYVTARRQLGGAISVVQGGPQARPWQRTCTCDCWRDDEAWQDTAQVLANNTTYAARCTYACQHLYDDAPMGRTCAWAP